MKKIISIIITIVVTSLLFATNAQMTEGRKQKSKEFKNQGEQEDYWAEQLFKEKYSKQHYDKYNGDITGNGNSFSFGDRTFIVINTSEEILAIFSSGLFYPSLIVGDTKIEVKSSAELDSLSAEERAFYNMGRTDSLTISDFEELKFLNSSPKRKRFKFWLWQHGFANPTAYFIELSNKKATNKTNFEDFVKGASLSFFMEGWIGI
jgi:hypothetical protein